MGKAKLPNNGEIWYTDGSKEEGFIGAEVYVEEVNK